MRRVKAIDSHTEGEPTRVILSGGPNLGSESLQERREIFARDHDDFRRMSIEEPRGSDVLVGALLLEAHEADCVAGVIFFNNAGMLGMCGHGTIGVARTLAHLGRIKTGTHRLDTPVGVVEFTLRADDLVEVANVPSHRAHKGIAVEVAGLGVVTGDVAWGGNWFFIAPSPLKIPLQLDRVAELTAHAWSIRRALATAGITGDNGGEIDHIEFTEPPRRADCAWRNFVLCPGGAYDRSPCGTGTSAKVACLVADGKIALGERIGAESFIGTRFEAWHSTDSAGVIRPTVAGRAWITAEIELMIEASDPCAAGILKQ
ncbi:MAG: proline racemase family protein [Planctomycetota bacterium]|nr:proline racemase family protein [Planctomycetota bacterium]MDA1263085.1 proline racemase family protein [Planctomycetota bacterium]